MTDIVKKSGVREAAGDANVGREVYEAVDERAREIVEQAVERAQANDRRTVKARDV